MVRISKFSYENPRFRNLLSRGNSIPEGVEITVREVLRNVKERGDVALYEYMNEFDQVDMEKIGVLVTEEEFAMAREKVSEEFKESVRRACDNLFKFHKRQIPAGYSETYEDGAVLERKYTPINSVAINVPGNMAPLISTLCMNLVPAIVAGVPNIYILTKPKKDGSIDEHLLYVANYLGVKNYYKLSGSQGLAAVAYGTETVKKVDSIQDAARAVNEIAPEHAELLLENPQDVLDSLTNVGAVFVGEYSTEPVGDYFCGTNHILPTCGTARFSSGMSVQEFMRGYSVIQYPESALKKNADYIVELAESENMMAHALAVKVRC